MDGVGSLLALNILLEQMVVNTSSPLDMGEEVERLPLAISYTTGLRKDGDTAPDGLDDILKRMQQSQVSNAVRWLFLSGLLAQKSTLIHASICSPSVP